MFVKYLSDFRFFWTKGKFWNEKKYIYYDM
jgi:hypothetical protein